MNMAPDNGQLSYGGEHLVRDAIIAAEPVTWPDPQPWPSSVEGPAEYPFDALPPQLREAASEVARFAKVPIASPAVVGLSTVATALGKLLVIEERPGLLHYPALFHLVVAASGERKSPVFKHMQKPLAKWEEEQEPAWQAACQKAEAYATTSRKMIGALEKKINLGMTGAERDEIERQIAAEHGRMVKLPPAPRLSTSDTTEERLFQLMDERGGTFSVMSGEGRPVIDAIVGRYSDGRTGDSIYLAGISGDAITRDRVGNERTGAESRKIQTPALNVCAMVQPDKLLEAVRNPSLRSSGAIARMSLVWLPTLVGTRLEERDEAGLNDLRLLPFYAAVENILARRMASDGSMQHLARLSTDAAESRRRWHNDIELQMKAGSEFEDMRDVASKAVSSTIKLAGLLHVLSQPYVLDHAESEISLQTWESAKRIGIYHLAETVRILRLSAADENLTEAVRVVNWIATRWEKSEVSASDVMQLMPRPRPNDVAGARKLLRTLVDLGYLMVRPPESGTRERKEKYLVHPRIREFVPNIAN